MSDIPTLITIFASVLATLYTTYKLIVTFRQPRITDLVDRKIAAKLDKLDLTITKLIEKDNALEHRVFELGSQYNSQNRHIVRVEKEQNDFKREHADFTKTIYSKIDNMGKEIIQIIRDQK